MNKVKIIHASDMHFDTPFKDVGTKIGKINRQELKDVFFKIINFCNDKKVQMLLIPGDVFDNITLNKETVYFLENALSSLKNTYVFISPGNHDPYGRESFYSIVKWPENVYIFKGDMEKVYLQDLNVTIWGAAFVERYQRETLMKNFDVDEKSINILVLHGEIVNQNEKSDYNPITIEQIKKSGMDYIALGHTHKYSGINKIDKTSYAYSGCIQGRGFDETGDKGIIYGDVYKGNTELQFIKMSKRNYYCLDIDVSGCIGYQELSEMILEQVNENDRKNNFYKIVLHGAISEEFNIDTDIIHKKIETYFYFCKIIDRTTKEINIDKVSKEYSVKGIFVNKMMEQYESAETEEEKQVIEMALRYGLEALTDEEVTNI